MSRPADDPHRDERREATIRPVLDLRVGFALLTRLPVAPSEAAAGGRLARCHWTFPVVGLTVGTMAGLTYAAAHGLGLPPMLAALVAIVFALLVTGAMHEDGLADLCDGLGGGTTRERRLEIMRDSRIGAYGASGLIVALAFRGGTIAALAEPWTVLAALAVTGAASRLAVAGVQFALPPARRDGMAVASGRANATSLLIGAGVAVVAAFILLPIAAALAMLVVMAVATAGVSMLARVRLGGQTGDVLGAVQQVTEIAGLLVLTALVAA